MSPGKNSRLSSAQNAARGIKSKIRSADLTATGESVARDFLHNYPAAKPPNPLLRIVSGWKVRKKLALLHNLFFIALSVSVYLSVIPLFSQHLEATRASELHMLGTIFSAELPIDNAAISGLTAPYQFKEGSAKDLNLSPEGRQFLSQHPAATWQDGSNALFRKGKAPGQFRRLQLSSEFFEAALRQARLSLFVVLGTLYLLTIIIMEFFIMPQYVYHPLSLMLEADAATQQDDRDHEMIDAEYICNDEIGQIMRSRNATVAQLRQQEDNLAHALQKLEEQDRLVSLGLLSTSVAHELNTPLAVLQGSIEKLLESTADSHTLERLARMLRVTQRLRKISEGLVDFARVRNPENEAVLLRSLIDESWNLVAIDEKASAVNFENNVRPGDTVLGNADRLVQVFVNLLRNALLAVSSGGFIRVESKALMRGGQSWISCAVLDNGPGIPADVLPNLFEAFVTTRLDARGTGLGLTVAEGIISQHGGSISASNRGDGGACLEVLLPAAPPLEPTLEHNV
ncbi:MAG TPA: HAMP domain-containing sensor histidine kinase [Bryobacteraceae bacterium]|nr:HAMP domain-containing sensor histidine kinase [Bryobacteraceae bacterium]